MNVKPNALFTNDNLFVLNGMNSACVDMIYLDPPFNSKRFYSAPIGSQAAGASFKDMWTWDDVDWALLVRLTKQHPHFVQFIQSIERAHGRAMMSYIAFMAQRVFEMHRVLKPTGSIYLHCDQTAGHYLKIMLDFIFGSGNFRNEIVWWYNKWTNAAKHFQRNHDVVLAYSKSEKYVFNRQYIQTAHKEKVLERGWDRNVAKGVRQLLVYDRAKAKAEVKKARAKKTKIVYMDKKPEGVAAPDVWSDINYLSSGSKERVGYPTQKPVDLLKRIIAAGSDEGGVVLDPFCGCATTLVAAQHLRRRWIGIDVEEKAGELVRERLATEMGLFNDFTHYRDLPDRDDYPRANPRDKAVRSRLYGDQNGRCGGCRKRFDIENMETDHVVPRAKGGGDFFENFQLLCGRCNRIKGDRPMEYLLSVIAAMQEQHTMFGALPYGKH